MPAQHVGAGLFLHVAAQMAVRRPEDFFPHAIQMLNEFHCDTGGHNPVGASLNRRRGIGIDHNGAVRVSVAKSAERLDRAAKIQ